MAAAGGIFYSQNAELDGSGSTSVTIAANTTVEVANNTALTVLGTLYILGELLTDSAGYTTIVSFGDGTGASTNTLNGGGDIVLDDNGSNRLAATANGDTLVNVDDLIEGSGQIGSNSGLIVVNSAGGTIAATGTSAALVIQTGGQTLTNQGLIESIGQTGAAVAGLQINATTVDNVGGTLLASGPGAVVALSNATLRGGDLVSTGGGVIVAGDGTVFDGIGAVATITPGSVVEILNDNDIVVLGTLNNLGTLFDDSNGYDTDIRFGNGTADLATTLDGNGVLLLSDNIGNRLLANVAGDTLENAGNLIAGSGQIGANSGLVIINDSGGIIDATGSGSDLLIQTGNEPFQNAGLIESTGPAGLQISTTTITNTATGSLLADGGPILLTGGAVIVGGTLAASHGGSISTSNAALDGSAGAPVTIAADTAVSIDNDSQLALLGTLDLVGTLLDNSTGNGTDIVISSPTVTLIGGGTVALSDNGANRVYGADPSDNMLVNVDNTIEGAGQLGINSGYYSLALTNEAGGIIDATGTNALVLQTGGPSVQNAGLIEATGAGGLSVTNATTIDNIGSGELLAAGSSIGISNNAAIVGGTLVATGGGSFSTYGATFDGGQGAPVTIAADTTVSVDNDSDLSLLGTLDIVGTLLDNSTGNGTDIVLASPTVTLVGGGTLALSDNGANRVYGIVPGDGTLVNVDDTIEGAGQLGVNSGGYPLALINESGGVIDASGANALVLQVGGPPVQNAGLIEATGPGGLSVTNATTIDNTGTGVLFAAGSSIGISNYAAIAGGTLVASGVGVFTTSNATFDGSAGAPVTIAAATTVRVDNDTELSLLGTLDIVGTLLDDSAGYGTDIIVGSPTVALVGGGTLALSDNGGNRIYGAGPGDATLVNVDDTIEGAGYLGVNSGGNPLALVNQAGGIIDANGANALVLQVGGPAVQNAGLIEATGGGGLSVTNNTTIENSGTGELLAAASPIGISSGAVIVGGTLAATGGGSFSTSNVTFDGSQGAPVTIAADTTVSVDNDTRLSLLGTLDIVGTLLDNSAGYGTDIVVSSPTVTLIGGGTLALSDNGGNYIYGSGPSDDTLDNIDDTIAGAGYLGVNSGGNPLALINEVGGTVDATGGNALVLQTGGPIVVNDGLMEATGPGGLDIYSTTVDNGGTIAAAGASEVFFRNDAGATNNSGGTLTGGTWLADGSTASIVFQAGAPITTDAADIVLDGSGTTFSVDAQQIEQSLTLIATGGTLGIIGGRDYATANTLAAAATGSLELGGGTVTTAGLTLAAGAALGGFGTVGGPVTDDGLITATGGELTLADGASGNGTIQIDADSTLELGAPASAGIAFAIGAVSTLVLDEPQATTGTFTNLAKGDIIDFADTTVSSATLDGTTLHVTIGGTVYGYSLASALPDSNAIVTPDAAGTGDDVVITPTRTDLADGVINTPNPIVFANSRLGIAPTVTLDVTNAATSPAEALGVTATASGDVTEQGTIVALPAGQTDTTHLVLSLDSQSVGVESGMLVVDLMSDGGDGEPATVLGSETLTASGTVYRTATGSIAVPTDLYLHVNDPGTVAVAVTNTASTDGYSEDLRAATVASSGGVTLSGSSGLIAAGVTDTADLGIAFSTTSAGTIAGSVTVDLVSDGTGTDGATPLDLGDVGRPFSVTVDNYATAALVQTGGTGALSGVGNTFTLDFGTHPLTDATLTADFAVLNTAVGQADVLDGNFTETDGVALTDTGFAALSGLAAGGSADASSVSFDLGTIGSYTQTIVFTPTGSNAGGYSEVLPQITLVATGTVEQATAVASASVPSSVSFGAVHEGQPASKGLTIANTASPPAESLDASIGGFNSGVTASGSLSLLPAGSSDDSAITVGISTGSPGLISGDVVLDFASDGATTDGGGTTPLPAQTIEVSGTVYALATPAISAPVAKVHIHDAAVVTLDVSNTTANSGYAEDLDASVSGFSGNVVSASGSVTLAPATSNIPAGPDVAATFTTTTAGIQTGTVDVALASDGTTIDGLGTTSLGTDSIPVTVDVFDYAQAELEQTGGAGSIVDGTLDLGTLLSGTGSITADLAVLNDRTDVADQLGGSISASGDSAYGNTGLGDYGLLGDLGSSGFTVSLSSQNVGTFSETITLASQSVDWANAATALPMQTLVVTGVVVAGATGLVTPGTVGFGNVHQGFTATSALSVTNNSSVPASDLDTSLATTGSASATGGATLLAPGVTASGAIDVSLATGTPGLDTGTVVVSFSADTGSGPTGVTGAQTVDVSAAVYRLASGTVTAAPVLIHPGETADLSLGVSNTAPADGYSENLIAHVVGYSGGVATATGSIELTAGASDDAALIAALSGPGDVFVDLVSDGSGVDGLGTTDLGTIEVPAAITLSNYATAELEQAGGSGSFSPTGTSELYVLNFGTVEQNSTSLVSDIAALNAAAGPADALSGTFDVYANGVFDNGGFGAFSGLGAGQADTSPTITFTTGQIGTFTEFVVLHPTGSNTSGYSATLPVETLEVTGTVVAPPPPPPPAAPTGIAWGDVHFTTFDGLLYNFQAVGEFVLAQSTVTGDSFQVQIRTAPYGSSTTVSVMTQVAARVGTDNVSFATDGTVRIGGNAVDIGVGNARALSGGQVVETSSDSYRIDWNTGEVLNVTDYGAYLSLTVSLGPTAGPGSVQGLLGSDSGQANDFELANGTVIPQPIADSDLYGEFADAWRVSQASSILYYANGTTTADYTNTTFPEGTVSLASVPQSLLQQAEEAVLQAGITDPGIAQAAILDYLTTGDPSFLTGGQNANQQGITTTETNVTGTGPAGPGVGVSADTSDVTAAASGTTPLTFTVTLSQTLSSATFVGWSVADGGAGFLGASAFGGVLPSGTISVAAGQTTAQFTVEVPQDALGSAPSAAVQVEITAPGGDTVFAASAQETLVNAVPSAGPPAQPQFYQLSGPGSLSGSAAGETIDLGAVIQGETVAPVRLAVANDAASGADNLAGNVLDSGSSGFSDFGLGPLPIIAGGGSYQGVSISANTDDPGSYSDTLTLTPTDENVSFYAAALTDQTVTIVDHVESGATGAITSAPSINLGIVHVGGGASAAITVENTATAGSANLDAVPVQFGGGITVSGEVIGLAPGASDGSDISVVLATGTDGVHSGLVQLDYTSDAGNGHVLSAGTSTAVIVTGTVFAYGHASITQAPAFAQAGGIASAALDVANTASADGYSENVIATVVGFSGAVTAASGSIELSAGASSLDALTVQLQAGEVVGFATGDVYVQLISDGNGIDNLGTTLLGTIDVPVAVTVDNPAVASVEKLSGAGTLLGASDHYTLDFGTVAQGSTSAVVGLGIANVANLPADLLSGSFSVADDSDFANAGLAAFSGIATGTADVAPSVTLGAGAVGVYTETLVVAPSTGNPSGYSAPLAAETIVVTGTVVAASTPELTTPIYVPLGDVRRGGILDTGVGVENAAAPGAAALDVSAGTLQGSAIEAGSITGLAPGAIDTSDITIGLSSDTVGSLTGIVHLLYLSDSGGGNVAAAGTATIGLTGTVYEEAAGTAVALPSYVHVGQSANVTISVGNTAATTGGYAESLRATIANLGTGVASGTGTADVAAGGYDDSSLVAGFGPATTAGILSGAVTVNFVSDGQGIDTLGTAELGTQYVPVLVQVNNYATAAIQKLSGSGALSPAVGQVTTLDFGTVSQNSVAETADLAIRNAAAGPADLLSGSFETVGQLPFENTGFAAFGNIGAGQADGGLSITLNTGSLGVFSETIVLNPADSNPGGFSATLQAQTLVVTGTVATAGAQTPALAEIDTASPIAFGDVRVGALATATIELTNAAAAPAQSLSATVAATGNVVALGTVTDLAAGATDSTSLIAGITTSSDGLKLGTVVVTPTSESSGNIATALPAQTLSVSGSVFREATPSLSSLSAIVHAGQQGMVTLTVVNSDAADGYSEDLDATVVGFTGAVTAAGGSTIVAPGTSDATSLTATLQAGATTGTVSGTVMVDVKSDGTGIDGFGPTDLGIISVPVSLIVDNTATAELEKLSGNGGISPEGVSTSYVLNLGTAIQNAAALSMQLGVVNAAIGPADLLSGSFTVPGGAPFDNAGLAQFSGIGAGQVDGTPVISMSTAQIGTFTEMVTLDPTGSNGSGYSGALAAETVEVTGTVIAPPPPPPPSAATGIAWGDVHLTTFDGLIYNFQAKGEFVLARSMVTDDSYQVQARLTPWTPNSSVSVMTEIGAQVGTDKVTFGLGRGVTVYVNGAPSSLSATNAVVPLTGGAVIETSPDSYRVIWNTGEVLDVTDNGSYLSLSTSLAPGAGAGSVVGLLGSDSGQANDFQLANGTVIPQPLASMDLYGAFADAWRVTQASSLLDYSNGQTTLDFTDTAFPGDAGSLANVPANLLAAAQEAVIQAGITDPGIAAAAELDFLETGDPGFLTGGQNAEQTGVITTAADVTLPPPSLGVGVSAVVQQETSASGGATAVDFTVTLTGTVDTDTAVGYTVTAPGGGYLDAASFGGVLPSGTVTIAAGQTTATIEIDVPQTALATLPTAALQVAITAASGDAVYAPTAQTTLVNSAPTAGPSALPEYGLLSGPGVLTGAGGADTIELGTFVQGEVVPQLRLGVANAGSAGSDSLGGIITGTSDTGFAAFGTGPMPILAGGASFQGLGVSVDTSTAGAHSALFTLAPTDQNATGYSAALADQTLAIEDTVLASATGTLTTTGPLDLGVVRVGGTLSADLAVANTATTGSAALDASGSATGGVTISGAVTQLAAGDSDDTSLLAALQTTADGIVSGTASVNFASDAGNGNTLAAGSAGPVAVTGTVFDIAHVTVTALPAIVHAGTAATVNLLVTNTDPSDGYSENLVATVVGHTGAIGSANGSVNLAAAASDSTQLTANFAAGAIGILSGEVLVGLKSDGAGIDGLSLLDLGTIDVSAAVTVDAFADLEIDDLSDGTAISNGETINLGTVSQGGSLSPLVLAEKNASSGPADVLGGTITTTGVAAFTPSGPSSFSGLAAEQSQGGIFDRARLHEPGFVLRNRYLRYRRQQRQRLQWRADPGELHGGRLRGLLPARHTDRHARGRRADRGPRDRRSRAHRRRARRADPLDRAPQLCEALRRRP